MGSSIAVFQGLVTGALISSPAANVSLLKRDIYSDALDSVNSIFEDIYGVADGSVSISEGSVERRRLPNFDIKDLICKLLGCQITLAKREISADVQVVIDTLNGMADGTIEFDLTPAADFTPEDAVELAIRLKDIVVAWRATVDGESTSSVAISARHPAPAADLGLYGVASHMEEKRWLPTRAQVKAGLAVLGAAITALSNAL